MDENDKTVNENQQKDIDKLINETTVLIDSLINQISETIQPFKDDTAKPFAEIKDRLIELKPELEKVHGIWQLFENVKDDIREIVMKDVPELLEDTRELVVEINESVVDVLEGVKEGNLRAEKSAKSAKKTVIIAIFVSIFLFGIQTFWFDRKEIKPVKNNGKNGVTTVVIKTDTTQVIDTMMIAMKIGYSSKDSIKKYNCSPVWYFSPESSCTFNTGKLETLSIPADTFVFGTSSFYRKHKENKFPKFIVNNLPDSMYLEYEITPVNDESKVIREFLDNTLDMKTSFPSLDTMIRVQIKRRK